MKIILTIVVIAMIVGLNSNHVKDNNRRSKWWDEDNK